MKRALVVLWALCASCATTPPPKPTPAHAGGETPEVPYQPQPVAGKAAEPTAAAVAPATGGEVKPVAAEPPAPTKPTFDSQTQNTFKEGVEAASRGDLDAAERSFKSVINQNSKADYAYTNLGMIYERRGDVAAAESAYRKALEIRPDQDVAWDSLARLYCRTKRCNAFENEVRQKIAEQPGALGLRTARAVRERIDTGDLSATKINGRFYIARHDVDTLAKHERKQP